MKTKLQLLILENPITMIRTTLVAMLMVLLTGMVYAQNTVVDVIVNSAEHNTLEAAVIAAELADDLSGEGPFTVFAPTDAAFDALPEGTVASLLEDPTGELAQILLYHVVGGLALSTDLSDGQMVTTLNGDSLTVMFMEGKVYIDGAEVIVADIETDNGVVHVIDAVMLPMSTVVDVIVGSADHNTLEAAVIAAELADDLSGEGPFTVFAPTDAAFDALPEGTVAALLEDPTGELAQILLYHVVGGLALSTDLSDGQMVTTLESSDIMVSFSDGKVFINGAMVSVANIETDNGVVHVIDAVLIPSTTTGINEMIIDKANVSVYPNPVSELLNVSFEVTKDSDVNLEMYNLQGQQVRVQQLGYTPMGYNTAEMGVSDLESGLYVVIINTGNSQVAKKVRVVK